MKDWNIFWMKNVSRWCNTQGIANWKKIRPVWTYWIFRAGNTHFRVHFSLTSSSRRRTTILGKRWECTSGQLNMLSSTLLKDLWSTVEVFRSWIHTIYLLLLIYALKTYTKWKDQITHFPVKTLTFSIWRIAMNNVSTSHNSKFFIPRLILINL